MTTEERELLIKYNSDECTQAEKAAVESWLFELNNTPIDLSAERLDLIRDEIRAKLVQSEILIRPLPSVRWLRIAIAASIIICLSVGGYSWFRQNARQSDVVQNSGQDVAPGGNKAVLTLASGKKISLTHMANGNIAQQSGTSIIQTTPGQLIYTDANSNKNSIAIGYNTVETPNGGQYQVHLPDGTSVWLNAASSLKYPTSFVSLKQRTVLLTGEAYFEVAKDKTHPFVVKTAGQEVEVLGTHFNINAYDKESETRTTLLEGSVLVTNAGSAKKLIPGQQMVLSSKGLTINETDTETAVAWKDGYFRFNSENIVSIMKKLARWYDLEVSFEGDVRSKSFTGKISRSKSISQVLKMLGKTKEVHFKIKGREVTVSE